MEAKKKELSVMVDVENARYLVACTDGMGSKILTYENAMNFMRRANSLGYLASVEMLIPVDMTFQTECCVSLRMQEDGEIK